MVGHRVSVICHTAFDGVFRVAVARCQWMADGDQSIDQRLVAAIARHGDDARGVGRRSRIVVLACPHFMYQLLC